MPPKKQAKVQVTAPNFETAVIRIRGLAPYVQKKFSQGIIDGIRATQEAGSTAKKGKKREPKDFKAQYEGAQHRSTEGWYGIPAAAIRNALISACRIVGFKMTRAKLGVFVIEDGREADGTGLIRITKGKPECHEMRVRLPNGAADICHRPMWREGWEATLRIMYDADMFTAADIANLLVRAGLQVGIGEGRPDSKSSNGLGWGIFEVRT